MDYWEECISCAFDDADIKATEEQISEVAGFVEVSHENYGMAFGHDAIPNPSVAEESRIHKKYKATIKALEKEIETYRKSVARRRNVDYRDVYLDNDDICFRN